jgi:hypothetical protein
MVAFSVFTSLSIKLFGIASTLVQRPHFDRVCAKVYKMRWGRIVHVASQTNENVCIQCNIWVIQKPITGITSLGQLSLSIFVVISDFSHYGVTAPAALIRKLALSNQTIMTSLNSDDQQSKKFSPTQELLYPLRCLVIRLRRCRNREALE